MTRLPAVLTLALVLAVAAPVDAAGCVLADDPRGDVSSPSGSAEPGYDLVQVRVAATRDVLRFQVQLADLPARPAAPTHGHHWVVWFDHAAERVHVNFFRNFYEDGAKAAIGLPSRLSVTLQHEFDERTRTLTAWLPYVRLGLEPGAVLAGDESWAGPVAGVWLPPVGDEGHSVGTTSGHDRVRLVRDVVAGRGCR